MSKPPNEQALKRAASRATESDDDLSLNVAVVRGVCSSPAEVRELASGETIAQLQVTTRTDDQAVSVPVSVWDPPAWVEALAAGDELLALGRVRRRFFRTPTGTASRVEVEADFVAKARDRRRATAARRRLEAALAPLDD
jgi:single-strand DNA-binding protein